ncbi:hypothetical protein N752_13410 [Desulforamulus aquiferis]|nr:hypothetical protein N752_13410 [Desulforamulus aquiferis]
MLTNYNRIYNKSISARIIFGALSIFFWQLF